MRAIGKKSTYIMTSIFFSSWFIVSLIAGSVLDGYKNKINDALGLEGYRTEVVENPDENTEYFKSSFVKKTKMETL